MKKILLIVIPIIVLIGLGIGAFRAYSQMKNLPSSSVKNLREIISRKDSENFYRLFDAEAILSQAAEEILTTQINSEINSTAYSMQEISNLYQARRPEFLETARAALDEYIKNGEIKFPETAAGTWKWFKDSDIDACVIKSFSKPVISDGKARTKIEFYNQALNFAFELEVTFEKLGKSEWRVVSARGFEDYLISLNRALKKKLERINAPVQVEINDIFKMKGFNAKVVEGDEYGFSRTMKLDIKADVTSEKNLSKILGQIIIVGRDGNEGTTPFEIDMAYKPTGLQTFTVDKVLNPFVKEDAEVMKHGLKKSSLHIEITEIIFMDGTSLKKLDSL